MRGLAALFACAAPSVALAQPAGDLAQGRTGPGATPPSAPAYAQPPVASLIPPASPGAVASRPAPSAPLREVRVAAESPPTGPARPPAAWRPAMDAAADLRLEHAPGESLDAAWVRRQFAANGLPAGGFARALALVQVINRAFLGAGFVNSGLVVRPSPEPGVLDLRIVYGGLAPPGDGAPPISVTWTGDDRRGLSDSYVRDRMPAALRRPLSAVDLERDFRLLAEDPAIRTVNADLRPGARPGEASLGLDIYPADRFDLYVTAANSRSPSVGGERLSAGGSIRNALLAGDLLSGEAGVTKGVEDVTLSYAVPFLNPRTTLQVRGAYNDAAVTDTPLLPLDIEARDRAVEGGVTHKLFEAPLLPTGDAGRWSSARTFTLGALVAWRRSETFLLGQPFSFAPGSVDGRSRYTALRLVGDYVERNVDRVFAVSLTATRGLDGTRSDIPGLSTPRKGFHAALLQVNYARRLPDLGAELRLRLSGQWSDSVLYSGERFSAGGENTVRGYRENLLLADRGVVGSVELARAVRLGGRPGATFDWGAFTVSVFADGAYMRNYEPPHPERAIYGVGASLVWSPSDALSARVTYAEDLKYVEPAGRINLQDRGFQFRVTTRPLRWFR
jgi:hemolysin activation/secretion protein